MGALLSPFVKLGGKYLDNQKDKERLKATTTQVAYNADAAVRKVKFGNLLGRLPLFTAEMSVAMYVVAIMVDSTFPSDYINPLELPLWFKPHFSSILTSIVGLSVVERVANRFAKK